MHFNIDFIMCWIRLNSIWHNWYREKKRMKTSSSFCGLTLRPWPSFEFIMSPIFASTSTKHSLNERMCTTRAICVSIHLSTLSISCCSLQSLHEMDSVLTSATVWKPIFKLIDADFVWNCWSGCSGVNSCKKQSYWTRYI